MLYTKQNRMWIVCLFCVCMSVLMYQYMCKYDIIEGSTIDTDIARIKQYNDILDEVIAWTGSNVNYKGPGCDVSSLLVLNNMMEEILKIECILNTNKAIYNEWIDKISDMIEGNTFIFESYLPDEYRNRRNVKLIDGDSNIEEGKISKTSENGQEIIAKLNNAQNIYDARKDRLTSYTINGSNINLLEKVNCTKKRLHLIKSYVCKDGLIGQS